MACVGNFQPISLASRLVEARRQSSLVEHSGCGVIMTYPHTECEGFYAVADVGRVPPTSCFLPKFRMLIAAFVSLSNSAPHSQECHRSPSVFLTTAPHPEHI